MKIGIFGGTFNPPHKGHRFLLEQINKRMEFDRMIIIPSSIPPHKEVAENQPEHRLAMTRLAFPDYMVSDMELSRKGKSFTVDTLRILAKEHPGDRLYFLCGSDMFLSMETWREPKAVFSLATIVTAARERGIYPKLLLKKWYYAIKYHAHCKVLRIKPMVLSSSDIREGELAPEWLDPAVDQYIREYHLYSGE